MDWNRFVLSIYPFKKPAYWFLNKTRHNPLDKTHLIRPHNLFPSCITVDLNMSLIYLFIYLFIYVKLIIVIFALGSTREKFDVWNEVAPSTVEIPM